MPSASLGYVRASLVWLTKDRPYQSYLWLLSSLLTVDFTIDNCVLKGSEQEFSQREIEMKLEMCGQKSVFISKGLLMVTEFLDQNCNSSFIIFCKSRNQSLHLSSHLNKKLDLAKLSVDVLNINGSLDKMEKFWRIRLICDSRHSPKGNFRALVTTNASNVRIDKHSISLQVRFGWPHNLLTYFKERGRGSQLQGDRSTCILFGNLSSYIYLMSQMILTSRVDDISDQVTGEGGGC